MHFATETSQIALQLDSTNGCALRIGFWHADQSVAAKKAARATGVRQ